MSRSIHQIIAEKHDYDYEEEILQTVQNFADEISKISRDLKEFHYAWEHTKGKEEPLWDNIEYHSKHIQMILDELYFKRAPYVEEFLADWESSGLIQEEDGTIS